MSPVPSHVIGLNVDLPLKSRPVKCGIPRNTKIYYEEYLQNHRCENLKSYIYYEYQLKGKEDHGR
jgi:hypothetical protein